MLIFALVPYPGYIGSKVSGERKCALNTGNLLLGG